MKKRSFIIIAFLLVFSLLCTFAAMQASEAQDNSTGYVENDSTIDGTSWATSSGTMQAMIDAIMASGSSTLFGANPESSSTDATVDGDYSFIVYSAKSGTPIGLVSYWAFNEGTGTIAYDSTNGNDGAITGADWTTGISAGALEFDGISDGVNVGSGSFPFSGVTMIFWVKLGNVDGGFLGGYGANSQGEKCFVQLTGSSIYIETWGGPNPSLWTVDINTEEWHQIVVQDVSPISYKVYLDGVDLGEHSQTNLINLADQDFFIGRHVLGDRPYFNGSIDEVRIYDRMLSGQEILDLYGKMGIFTNPATNVGTSTVTLNGTLYNMGTASSVSVAFEYGTQSGSYPYSTPAIESPMNGTGSFHADISSLISNTTYYYRAKRVGAGTDCGSELSFTTPQIIYELIISSDANGDVVTPGEGTYPYAPDTVVQIVAQGSYCYEFVDWTGTGTPMIANPGSPNTTITIEGNCSITATFVPQTAPVELTTSSSTGGSVIVPGESVYPYACGTVVVIVAEASPCYEFTGWTGTGTPFIADRYSANTIIAMNDDCFIKANFEMTCVEVDIKVNLQGTNRSPDGWKVPITVGFFEPGADVLSGTPVYLFSGTTVMGFTSSGTRAFFHCPDPVVPGTYDITTDSTTTLMNVKRNVHIQNNESRKVFPGQYVAIGNSLMEDTNGDRVREPLPGFANQNECESEAYFREEDLPDVSQTNPSDDVIWEDMEITNAFLYWTGWYYDQLDNSDNIVSLWEDDCSNFDDWNPGANWNANGVFSARHTCNQWNTVWQETCDDFAAPVASWDINDNWTSGGWPGGRFIGQDHDGSTEGVCGNRSFSDDFESYADDAAFQAVWGFIGNAWELGTDLSFSPSTSAKCDRWDETLISPEVDTSGCASVTVSFRYWIDDIDGNDNVYLRYWDGSNWDNIEEIGDDAEDVWLTYNHTISDAQYLRNDFKIRIDGASIDDGENLWIDDFSITGNGCPAAGPGMYLEMQVASAVNFGTAPYNGGLGYAANDLILTWEMEASGDVENTDGIEIWLWNSTGTGSWVKQAEYWCDGLVNQFLDQNPSIVIDQDEYLDQFRVQFRLVPDVGGWTGGDEYCYIDNIEVRECIVVPVQSDRELELSNDIYTISGEDLSKYSDLDIYLHWDQWATGTFGPEDKLTFFLSADSGITWSGTQFATALTGSREYYEFLIPNEYRTSQFKFKFKIEGFDIPGKLCYVDDIGILLSFGHVDAKVKLAMDTGSGFNWLYWDENGIPAATTFKDGDADWNKINATASDFLETPDENHWDYAAYCDVTELVNAYFDPEVDNPAAGIGFKVSNVYANTSGSHYEWAHAGWSMVIVFQSPQTVGHEIFLYDVQNQGLVYSGQDSCPSGGCDLDFQPAGAPGDTDNNGIEPDPDGDGIPGWSIDGFLVPSPIDDDHDGIADEDYVCRITAMVGEGDPWYGQQPDGSNSLGADYLKLNGKPLLSNESPYLGNIWDSNCWNPAAVPWNVYTGLDLDTFEVGWDETYGGKPLLEPGDTEANVSIGVNGEIYYVVYMIASMRSE